MGRIYDNWERLVTAVVRREQLRQIARNHSRNSSTISSGSSDDFDLSNESHFIDDDQLPAATTDHTSDYEEITSTLQTQGFYVDELTKKQYMLGAKELLILMRRTSQYWDWTADAGSRFSEVAVLHYGRCLDIRGRIKTQMLSSGTTYAAYLVFKLTEWSKGLESANAVVNIFRAESDRDAQKTAQIVHLQPGRNPMGTIALRRIDGWMEVEIGKFYVDVHDEEVEAQILELTSWKVGLTVEGIEFRPLYSEAEFAFPQPLKLYLGNLTETDDSNDDNHEIKSRSSDLEMSPIFVNGDLEVRKDRVVAETEKAEETEIDIYLLQEFAPLSLAVRPDPSSRPPTSIVSPPLPPSAQSKQKNNNSLQDDGVGEEMMAKLLLPADEPLLASLTRDELISSGYDSLSKVVYFFDGMKRMIELKDRESDDLKQKLLKNEVETQLALASKDCELEELKKIVNVLKSDIEKVQDNAREEVRKADEKVKRAEREVENAEARAASAIENYKNSHDLKVDKHKFASKAFAIGFDLCKKQVLEVDPNFDFSRIDIKCLEA